MRERSRRAVGAGSASLRGRPPQDVPTGDLETRARLLAAAAKLFAERGFARVTVRDICKRAQANVAAVNYHFGGKEGLYTAVMNSAIETMRATTLAAMAAGEGLSAEGRLRAYIKVVVQLLMNTKRDTSIHQLMMREIADPTPALDMVAKRVIKPRMDYLCGTISELIGLSADDLRVIRCALSIQSQFHALLWTQMLKTQGGPMGNAPALEAVADHIAQFSLAGVRGLR